MIPRFCLLLVAKAPVPGFAKTRLCPPATYTEAAEIAAASLLDTLDAVCGVPGATPVVAITGDLGEANRRVEIERALRQVTVIPQRGQGLGARLANAHADVTVVHAGLPVLQIGMDTPQVTPQLLATAMVPILGGMRDALLGLAEDGGWWALGLADPRHARVLAEIPMSCADTGERTLRALTASGLRPGRLPILSDVDTMADAHRVATARRDGQFACAVAAVSGQAVAG